jgi:hypothetical protein
MGVVFADESGHEERRERVKCSLSWRERTRGEEGEGEVFAG